LSNIRDLTVGIEFDNVDISELLRVDSAIDEIEAQLQAMGINIDDATQEFDTMGSTAAGALSNITTEAENAGDAVNILGDSDLNTLNGQIQTGVFNQQNFNDSAALGGRMLTGLRTIGVAAFAAIGAAAGVAVGAVVATVVETENAFDRLEAKTGTIGAEFEGLKNVSKDVFVNGFGPDLLTVTDDVATMKAMFGDLNNEELKALTKSAYTIGDLWGPEVKEVGKTVKTMTAQFKGLSEADALDLMTTAFQETGDHSDDLMDTFSEYSGFFQKLGFDAKGFTNVLVKGAKAGAFTTDLAADAIKEFGIRSIDASEGTADGFKAIGLDAKEMTGNFAEGGDKAQQAFAATVAGLSAMKDPVKQNAAGVALFGTQWEDLREGVILAMTDGTDAVGNFKGATKEAGDAAYNNFGSRMTSVFRDLKLKIADAFTENGGGRFSIKSRGVGSKNRGIGWKGHRFCQCR
jgi:phage-related minor tail protein